MPPPIVRATRFPLHLPLQFRLVGFRDWHAGTTENISHTGVLFRTYLDLAVGAPIEIQIALGESAPHTAHCQACVVRADTVAAGGERMIAAVIVDHRLVRTASNPIVDILNGGPETSH